MSRDAQLVHDVLHPGQRQQRQHVALDLISELEADVLAQVGRFELQLELLLGGEGCRRERGVADCFTGLRIGEDGAEFARLLDLAGLELEAIGVELQRQQ